MSKIISQCMQVKCAKQNYLTLSVLSLQLPDQTKFYFDVTIFLQTTKILQSAIQY